MLRAWAEAVSRSIRVPAAPSAPAASRDALGRSLTSPARRGFSSTPWRQQQQQRAALPRYGHARPVPAARPATLRGQARRGFRFSAWRGGDKGKGGGDGERLSMGERFKKLSREYGKAAVGVYLLLSVLDYPFFFLLVRTVGTERIGKFEHFVVTTVTSVVPEPVRVKVMEYWNAVRDVFRKDTGQSEVKDSEGGESASSSDGWGVDEARERHKEEASLATQFALAYAIHKSFFFVRIPLTVAVTPRVVKTLRSWGWNIGKPLRKSS